MISSKTDRASFTSSWFQIISREFRSVMYSKQWSRRSYHTSSSSFELSLSFEYASSINIMTFFSFIYGRMKSTMIISTSSDTLKKSASQSAQRDSSGFILLGSKSSVTNFRRTFILNSVTQFGSIIFMTGSLIVWSNPSKYFECIESLWASIVYYWSFSWSLNYFGIVEGTEGAAPDYKSGKGLRFFIVFSVIIPLT